MPGNHQPVMVPAIFLTQQRDVYVVFGDIPTSKHHLFKEVLKCPEVLNIYQYLSIFYSGIVALICPELEHSFDSVLIVFKDSLLAVVIAMMFHLTFYPSRKFFN